MDYDQLTIGWLFFVCACFLNFFKTCNGVFAFLRFGMEWCVETFLIYPVKSHGTSLPDKASLQQFPPLLTTFLYLILRVSFARVSNTSHQHPCATPWNLDHATRNVLGSGKCCLTLQWHLRSTSPVTKGIKKCVIVLAAQWQSHLANRDPWPKIVCVPSLKAILLGYSWSFPTITCSNIDMLRGCTWS